MDGKIEDILLRTSTNGELPPKEDSSTDMTSSDINGSIEDVTRLCQDTFTGNSSLPIIDEALIESLKSGVDDSDIFTVFCTKSTINNSRQKLFSEKHKTTLKSSDNKIKPNQNDKSGNMNSFKKQSLETDNSLEKNESSENEKKTKCDNSDKRDRKQNPFNRCRPSKKFSLNWSESLNSSENDSSIEDSKRKPKQLSKGDKRKSVNPFNRFGKKKVEKSFALNITMDTSEEGNDLLAEKKWKNPFNKKRPRKEFSLNITETMISTDEESTTEVERKIVKKSDINKANPFKRPRKKTLITTIPIESTLESSHENHDSIGRKLFKVRENKNSCLKSRATQKKYSLNLSMSLNSSGNCSVEENGVENHPPIDEPINNEKTVPEKQPEDVLMDDNSQDECSAEETCLSEEVAESYTLEQSNRPSGNISFLQQEVLEKKLHMEADEVSAVKVNGIPPIDESKTIEDFTIEKQIEDVLKTINSRNEGGVKERFESESVEERDNSSIDVLKTNESSTPEKETEDDLKTNASREGCVTESCESSGVIAESNALDQSKFNTDPDVPEIKTKDKLQESFTANIQVSSQDLSFASNDNIVGNNITFAVDKLEISTALNNVDTLAAESSGISLTALLADVTNVNVDGDKSIFLPQKLNEVNCEIVEDRRNISEVIEEQINLEEKREHLNSIKRINVLSPEMEHDENILKLNVITSQNDVLDLPTDDDLNSGVVDMEIIEQLLDETPVPKLMEDIVKLNKTCTSTPLNQRRTSKRLSNMSHSKLKRIQGGKRTKVSETLVIQENENKMEDLDQISVDKDNFNFPIPNKVPPRRSKSSVGLQPRRSVTFRPESSLILSRNSVDDPENGGGKRKMSLNDVENKYKRKMVPNNSKDSTPISKTQKDISYESSIDISAIANCTPKQKKRLLYHSTPRQVEFSVATRSSSCFGGNSKEPSKSSLYYTSESDGGPSCATSMVSKRILRNISKSGLLVEESDVGSYDSHTCLATRLSTMASRKLTDKSEQMMMSAADVGSCDGRLLTSVDKSAVAMSQDISLIDESSCLNRPPESFNTNYSTMNETTQHSIQINNKNKTKNTSTQMTLRSSLRSINETYLSEFTPSTLNLNTIETTEKSLTLISKFSKKKKKLNDSIFDNVEEEKIVKKSYNKKDPLPKLTKPIKGIKKEVYSFLEKKLLNKYPLERRKISERIVVVLNNAVSSTLAGHPDLGLEPLKQKLVEFQICDTQLDYYTFLFRFTPLEFRKKVIPMGNAYGNHFYDSVHTIICV